MLEAAIEAADRCGYVFVICANSKECERLAWRCAKMCGVEVVGMPKVYTQKRGQITFETSRSCQLMWEDLHVHGAFPACEVIVDHYAIESEFAKMLEMLHRFDPEGAHAENPHYPVEETQA